MSKAKLNLKKVNFDTPKKDKKLLKKFNASESDSETESISSDLDLDDLSIIDDQDGGSDTDKESDESINSDDDAACPTKYIDEYGDSSDEEKFTDDVITEKPDIKIVPPEKRITKPFMTKYERVRLTCDRAKQLSDGAKPLVKNIKGLSSLEIAKLELEHNIMPLILERPLPNGFKEIWHIRELQH